MKKARKSALAENKQTNKKHVFKCMEERGKNTECL